jgi:hypothetical protein
MGRISFATRWHIWAVVASSAVLVGCPNQSEKATEDIAQEWMQLIRDALFVVQLGPPPEALIFWHVSVAMYESCAAYDAVAKGYLTGDQLRQPAEMRTLDNEAETLSHAVYTVLRRRFGDLNLNSRGRPGLNASRALTEKMQQHGYIDAEGNIVESDAQALGTTIGELVLAYSENDGSNHQGDYFDNTGFVAPNPPIIANQPGTNGVVDPSLWQEIITPNGAQQTFLGAQWRHVTPFALPPYQEGVLRYEPGVPPLFDQDQQRFIDEMVEVVRVLASTDPDSGLGTEMLNLSPRVRGLETPYIPGETQGHPVNPATGQPYADHFVLKGDYIRVNAMYHDGKTFQTPVPWWNEVVSYVLGGHEIVSETPANKPEGGDLGYDVQMYFAAHGAMHDAGIAVREIKRDLPTSRPITGIRFLAEQGLLPIEEGLIEIIDEDDPLAGENGEFVGEQKVVCWLGPDQGVDWVRGVEWRPYQALDFVSPPFPSFTSGHAMYSRAAAEILGAFTGDAYFPGGLAELTVNALRFEGDLTGPVKMQAATYVDMADEVAFARVCTGVHIYADVIESRPIGVEIAQHAMDLAQLYFEGNAAGVAEELIP